MQSWNISTNNVVLFMVLFYHQNYSEMTNTTPVWKVFLWDQVQNGGHKSRCCQLLQL